MDAGEKNILPVSPVEFDIIRLHDIVRQHLLESYGFGEAHYPGIATAAEKIKRMIAERFEKSGQAI